MAEEATHWRQYTESKTLGVGDMPNPEEDWNVRITKVAGGKVAYSDGPAKKPMIYFEGVEKPLAAGATVCTAIANLLGSPNPRKWAGKLITLHADKTDSYGKKGVDCIRVRNVKPVDNAPPVETGKPAFDLEALLHAVATCSSTNSLNSLKPKGVPKSLSEADRERIKTAFTERRAHLEKMEAEADEMERAAFNEGDEAES